MFSFLPCFNYFRVSGDVGRMFIFKPPSDGQQRELGMNLVSRTLKKILHAPAEDRTGDPSIYSLALYHVAIKAGLYRKAVQVYYIPNLYPVTFSPSILNSSSNSQEYKNHLR